MCMYLDIKQDIRFSKGVTGVLIVSFVFSDHLLFGDGAAGISRLLE